MVVVVVDRLLNVNNPKYNYKRKRKKELTWPPSSSLGATVPVDADGPVTAVSVLVVVGRVEVAWVVGLSLRSIILARSSSRRSSQGD